MGWAAVFTLAVVQPVAAATGLRALDEPAIAVKAPAHQTLIAITRAGARLVAVGVHGLIVYSDDNGLTWKQADVPVSATLTAVRFATALDGWAAGHYGVILQTEDGGTHWRLQLNGLQANQLTLQAAQKAVAENDPSPGTPRALRRAHFLVAAGADKPFLTIWTRDAQTAIVFGAYRLAMETTDGGKTWQDWSLHIADPFSHNLYDAEAIGGDIYVAGELGLVFRSTDLGQSFQPLTPPAPATLFGILPMADHGVAAFGVAGEAFVSHSQGMSWAPLSLATDANLVAGCVLEGGDLLMAGEDGVLYLGDDQARHFMALPHTAPLPVYGAVQAANGNVITVGMTGIAIIPAAQLKAGASRLGA